MRISIASLIRDRRSYIFDKYAVNKLKPPLVADFDDEYYRASGSATTFSDLITHARAGNATMTDSDGLIKWAPHNLLTYSENYTAGKSSNNITLTSGVADPLGGTNAYTLTATAINGFFRGSSSITVVPQTTYTVAVFSKNVSGTIKIGAYDLTNGAPITSSELTNSTNEWALEFHEFTTPVGCTSVYVYAAQQTTNGASYDSFGFHTYRSDLGGMVNNPDRGDSYVPTTSSAVYLPRRGHHVYNGYEWVNEGVLAESEARTNLLPYSNDFTQWTSASTTITADDTTSPDGTQSADSLIHTGPADVKNTVDTTNTVTFSCYVKENSGSGYFRIIIVDDDASPVNYIGTWFKTSDGTFGTEQENGTGVIESRTVQDAGNGWYRLSVTASVSGSATGAVRLYITDADNSTVRSTTVSQYWWGAQVESASTSSSYIPTSGSSVTRAAETFTIPSAKLPWPTPVYIGDELVDNGDFATTSDWSLQSGVSIGGGVLSTDGTSTGELARQSDIGVTSGNLYAISLDVISLTAGKFGVKLGGTNLVYFDTTGSHEAYIVATATDNVQIMGLSGTTGSVDNVSVREVNPLSVSIQMKGEMDYADTNSGNNADFLRWLKDGSNYIVQRLRTSTGTGQIQFLQINSGVSDVVNSSTDAYTPGLNVPFDIASRHGSTFVNGAVDGVALTADTTPTALPDLSSTDLNLAYDYMGTLRTFRMWDKDLGDTGIAEATAPSLEPSLSLSFDSTESSFVDKGWSE